MSSLLILFEYMLRCKARVTIVYLNLLIIFVALELGIIANEFLSGKGDLTTISFTKLLYNLFCKGSRKHVFNKSALNRVVIPKILAFVISFDAEYKYQ